MTVNQIAEPRREGLFASIQTPGITFAISGPTNLSPQEVFHVQPLPIDSRVGPEEDDEVEQDGNGHGNH